MATCNAVCMCSAHLCVCLFAYVCVSVRLCVGACVWCVHSCVCERECMCMWVCIHVCDVHVCARAHAHACVRHLYPCMVWDVQIVQVYLQT